MKKIEKIRRKRITRIFNCYHRPLITASRYVKRETEGMFQAMYIDIKENWDIRGNAVVRVYAVRNGKMYRSKVRYFFWKEFDNMRKQDISLDLYCKAVLASEVFDLYAKIISKEDKKIFYKGQV